MLAKINHHFSVYRIVLLTLVLVLTGFGVLPTATASCNPGDRQTVLVDAYCCNLPYSNATIKQQECCAGVWQDITGPYCGPWNYCYF